MGRHPALKASRRRKRTWGTEPSQYPEEETSSEILGVAASERGRAETASAEQVVSGADGGLWGTTGTDTTVPTVRAARSELSWKGGP